MIPVLKGQGEHLEIRGAWQVFSGNIPEEPAVSAGCWKMNTLKDVARM